MICEGLCSAETREKCFGESFFSCPPSMFFDFWYALWPFQGMLRLVLGPYTVCIMSMQVLICRISHKPLVSLFIHPPLPVPPSDRSVGLPYVPNSLYSRVDRL